MQVEHQEQQKHPQEKERNWEHPQELEVVNAVMVEEWVQKMVESCKRQAWIPSSSADRESLEISDQPDQNADAFAVVAVPKLS